MEYVRLGKLGMQVSRLALGLGFRGAATEAQMEAVIKRALDLGINFFDCANIYGPMDDRAFAGVSEKVLGRVTRGLRDGLVIATKVSSCVGPGPNDAGSSRYHIMREIDRSLARLGMDHVDLYLLHQRDESTPMEESIRALEDLVRVGKIRYWGVSNWNAWELCKALWIADRINGAGPVCIQNPYSLLHRELEREIIPLCRSEGVGIMAYSPLAVGLLSGRYRKGQAPPPDTIWGLRRRDGFDSTLTDQAAAVIDAVLGIAAATARSPAQVAVNWVLAHPEATVADIGPSSVGHLEDLAGAVGWTLSAEDVRRLDEVSECSVLAVT